MQRIVSPIVAVCLLLGAASTLARSGAQNGPDAFPQTAWASIETPESVGFSSKRLAALRAWLESVDTTALMAIVGGRTLLTYGDVTHVTYLASGRKSVLALLYGTYVQDGTIPLDKTLGALEMDDVGGLMPREREATIQHLLTARSGIYHRPSNGGDDAASAPPRGSQAPGTRFLYNNWDFNAAGAVFEKLTHRNIYDALAFGLAQPLGMEDFDRGLQQKSGDLSVSRYPAYPMWLSTRDMARVGLLALRGGQWRDRQLVPRDWVRRVTSLATPYRDVNPSFPDSPPSVDRWGYGYMWWVYDAVSASDPLRGAFTAWGVGGQYITVIPSLDMVVAHKTDTGPRQGPPRPPGPPKAVTAQQYDVILRMLASAKCSGTCQ